MSVSMTSSRPYLIRALYEWIVDNGLTPYLLVDAANEALQAPMEYADNGRLVLNVSPRAVRDLDLGQDDILFSGRFGGRAFDVRVPVKAVLAIYARENGQGMLFSDGDDQQPPPGGGDADGSALGNGEGRGARPRLRVVK